MVISEVVKSLIINFSPSLIWLPGAVRSVCVGSLSSAGNIHYTCCVMELIFVKWWCWVSLKLQKQLPSTLRSCALLSTADRCPWCWRVSGCRCWKNSSTVPQHPHSGHLRDHRGLCEVIKCKNFVTWSFLWLWYDYIMAKKDRGTKKVNEIHFLVYYSLASVLLFMGITDWGAGLLQRIGSQPVNHWPIRSLEKMESSFLQDPKSRVYKNSDKKRIKEQ